MRSTFSSRARRWLGASALAILAGIGGGSAFVAATAPSSAQQAQLVPAAQIIAPAITNAPNFADLVEADLHRVHDELRERGAGFGLRLGRARQARPRNQQLAQQLTAAHDATAASATAIEVPPHY